MRSGRRRIDEVGIEEWASWGLNSSTARSPSHHSNVLPSLQILSHSLRISAPYRPRDFVGWGRPLYCQC